MTLKQPARKGNVGLAEDGPLEDWSGTGADIQ